MSNFAIMIEKLRKHHSCFQIDLGPVSFLEGEAIPHDQQNTQQQVRGRRFVMMARGSGQALLAAAWILAASLESCSCFTLRPVGIGPHTRSTSLASAGRQRGVCSSIRMGLEDEMENVKDLILKKIEGASLSSEVCRRDPSANVLVTSGGVNPPTRRSQGGKTCVIACVALCMCVFTLLFIVFRSFHRCVQAFEASRSKVRLCVCTGPWFSRIAPSALL